MFCDQNSGLLVCLFVCLIDVACFKPENPYFAFRPGLEIKPLRLYPLGPRSSSCGPTTHRRARKKDLPVQKIPGMEKAAKELLLTKNVLGCDMSFLY